MKSDEPTNDDDERLFRLLRDALSDPTNIAPPEVEARYAEIIRKHYARSRRLGWGSAGGIAACVTAVITVIMVGGANVMAILFTAGWSVLYGGSIKLLVDRTTALPITPDPQTP